MNSSVYDDDYPVRAEVSTLPSGILIGLISFANLFILAVAVAIMILSLGAWSDYVTCSFTIIIALAWTCCVCVQNNRAISLYGILMIIDMIFLLTKAILYIVDLFSYDSYCFSRNDSITNTPPTGCRDYENFGKAHIIAMVCCFFVAIICRLINIIGLCMLARNIYNNETA